ncbi:unnamed protein product [Adineta steineri]|uniref:Uncharacterized protein n=1 Tax=Adineta steineri TaxID=433720 RepID=A0A815N7R6_9BILA|nr:unnamed protein product [Adineta steineri]
MDNDTVFPALSGDEIIVGKYRGTDHSRMTKAIVILTNYRLLIRWQGTICGCFTRSSYSSIRLDSIDRIDDMRSDASLAIFFMIFVLVAGIISMIYGFVFGLISFQSLGTLVTIVDVVIFIFLWCSNQNRYITFKGSFGSETIIFQKTIANEFEERLSEMIHQRSIQCFTGKNEHNGSLLASEPSAPMVSRNIIDIEMETEKKYAYQPLPSVA